MLPGGKKETNAMKWVKVTPTTRKLIAFAPSYCAYLVYKFALPPTEEYQTKLTILEKKKRLRPNL